ncbi:MAG TPA: helix-turn-helix domain-containing protein [Anaerolineales bacterium]|nr:helix-turn-helix domain-containing protein [Anaerolineales bacterium]
MARKTAEIPPDSFSTFGEMLRYLRERAHLSQRDLAAQAGYHYSYISYLEKNARVPDVATIKARFIPVLGLNYEDEQVVEHLLSLAAQAQQNSLVSGAEAPKNSVYWNIGALSPIIGREQEAKALVEILLDKTVRFVTLIGPPGVGKTRLALHVAEMLRQDFENGVVFANLAPVDQEEAVFRIVSEVLDIQEEAIPSRQLVLQAFLRDKKLLIVLDNFEQVLPAARHLPNLLHNAPGVKFLVTSREALRLQGEHEFQLQPFVVPSGGVTQVSDSPAIQIFMDRARAVRSDFRLTDENASAVAEICRRLDGLPLALELAAARIGTFSLAAMLEQFDRRFQWLTRGRRDQPAWRQTLLGAVEWSYNLLTETERILFRRLSVFSGGWTLEAAEVVCSDASIPSTEIYSLLLQLIDRSLVVSDSHSRFHYLDTIQHFAAQKLEELGERESVRDRHLKYYATWAGGFASQMEQTFPREIRTLVEADHNNIRAALDWGIESPTSVEDGMRLSVGMGKVWLRHSNFQEGLEKAKSYLPLAEGHPAWKLELLYLTGAHSYWRDNLTQAKDYCRASLTLADRVEDRSLVLGALFYLGDILRELKEENEALLALESAINLSRELGLDHRLSLSLTSLARLLYEMKKYSESRTALQEALAIALKARDVWAECYALRVQADCLRFDGKLSEALPVFENALQTAIQIDDRISMGISLANMALLCNVLEDFEASGQYAERAFRIFQAIGNEYQQPFPQRMMAYAALHSGDLRNARFYCMQSIRGNQFVGSHTGALAGLLVLCEIELAQENIPQAFRIFNTVQTELAHTKATFMEPDQKTWERLKDIFNKTTHPFPGEVEQHTEVPIDTILTEYE